MSKKVFLVIMTLGFALKVSAAEPVRMVAVERCQEVLAAAHQSQPVSKLNSKIEGNKQVQIIWYPSSEWAPMTHTEFEVDGAVWDGTTRYRKRGVLEASQYAAANGTRGYLSFGLNVTPAEFENMKSYLLENEGKMSWSMCSGAACKAITKNSGIFIPPVLRGFPTLMAAYLTLGKMVGYKRIAKIQWVGPKKLSRYFSPSAIGFIGPVFEPVIAYGLLVAVRSIGSDVIQYFIPIIHHLGT